MAKDELAAAAAAIITEADAAAAAVVGESEVVSAADVVAAPHVAAAADTAAVDAVAVPDVVAAADATAAVVAAPEVAAGADAIAADVVTARPAPASGSADDDEGALKLLAEVVEKTKALTVTERTDAVASVENKEESAKNKVPVPASITRKKKLLVLNLNGLLADINRDSHNAHLSHGRFRGNLVFKRPFCDEFLNFCFRNFEVGLWSSRLSYNVDAAVDIVMKDFKRRLLFCWDATKCTSTGLYTLENKNKPLVLKELKRVWSKEDGLPWQNGEFSPTNTLLMDFTPYKALRNPPHTSIFPYPYNYKNRKDDSLGPSGDIRLYLEELATADDVPGFVREHPFGQPAITETHPNWNFYKQILLDD